MPGQGLYEPNTLGFVTRILHGAWDAYIKTRGQTGLNIAHGII